jgi:hypothetical protein
MSEPENKTEKALPAVIDELEGKQTVSKKLETVTQAKSNLQSYVDSYKGKKGAPADMTQCRKAIAHLKRAESEFDVKEEDIYTSGAAINASKRVISWIKSNSTDGTGILKVIEFQEKMEAAVKKKKAKENKPKNSGSSDNYKGERDDEIIKTVVALIPDALKNEKGEPKPLGKAEIKEALEKVADKAGKIKNKAVSGFVNAWISAGKSMKCNLLHEHKGKKYHPDKPESLKIKKQITQVDR